MATFSLTSCSLSKNNNESIQKPSITSGNQQNNVDQEIYHIYELYLASGGDLTYEQWLNSIRGKDGADGLTPHIGENGNWFIGSSDTGVKAQGPTGPQGSQGQSGSNGKTAYEIYKEAHPEYTKTEAEWLDDLVNGRLGSKELHLVTFDSQGGSYIPSQSVLHGEKAVKPKDPSMQGYVFDGWFYKDEIWAFQGYVVTENMTLVARWSEAYEVLFYDYDNTVLYSTWVRKGEEPIYPYSDPVRSDDDLYQYQFRGWTKTKNTSQQTILKADYAICSKDLDINNGTVRYSKDSAMTDIVIPSMWNGVTVTKLIGFNRSNITSVVIPDSLTEISDNAFFECKNLTSVTIGKNVKRIGKSAFKNCLSLTTIEIPKGVEIIDESAFEYCESLVEVKIGESVKTIGTAAFAGCILLETADLPADLEYIGNSAFADCYKLKNVVIGDKVTYLGARAFFVCQALEMVVVGKNITKILDQTFYGCTSVKSLTFKAPTISTVFMAFWCCGYNTDSTEYSMDVYFYLEKAEDWFNCSISTTLIGRYHLFVKPSYEELTVLEVPNTVTSIATIDTRFSFLMSVETLVLPANLTDIHEAIYDMTSLKTIIVDYNNPNYSSFDGALFNKTKTELIFLPYKHSGSFTIPASTNKGIDASTFVNCPDISEILVENDNPYFRHYGAMLYNKDMTKIIATPCARRVDVSLPATCLTVGDYAFANCVNLKSITIPDSVTAIGSHVFDGCSSLSNITIEGEPTYTNQTFMGLPATVNFNEYENGYYFGRGDNPYTAFVMPKNKDITSIQIADGCLILTDGAFAGAEHLENIVFSNTIKVLGNFILMNCSSLKSITLGSGITNIFNGAFKNCTSLETIVFDDNLLEIDTNAFANCISLKTLRLPNSLTKIGEKAFDNCTSLESVSFPASITTISSYAFHNCQSLESINLPGTITGFGWYVFQGCSSLKTVVLEDGFPAIKYGMFYNCASLETINIPESIRFIDDRAFYNCANLKHLVVPESLDSLSSQTFDGCDSLQMNQYDNGYYIGTPSNEYAHLLRPINKDISSCLVHPNCKAIASYAFQNCSSLTSMTIPGNVKYVGMYAFSSCQSLTNLIIEEGVEELDAYCIISCPSLKSIVLPNSLKAIGRAMFTKCGLDKVYYQGEQSQWWSIGFGLDNTFVYNNAYYYSENEPQESGNYWHYVEGVPTIW